MLLDLWITFAQTGYYKRDFFNNVFSKYIVFTFITLFRLPSSDLLDGNWLPLDRESKTRYLRISAEKTEMVNHSMPFHHHLSFIKD